MVREGLAQDSGLPPGSFDTAVVRLVLIHKGGREQEIVDHAASLVRRGGRVMLYDLDSTMIRVAPPTAPVSELHERYQAYQRARGNDPAVGLRLPELIESADLTLEAFRGTCSTRLRSAGERGLSWAARRAMVEAGVAAPEDVERWTRDRASALAAAPRGRPLTSSPACTGWACPTRGSVTSCAASASPPLGQPPHAHPWRAEVPEACAPERILG